MLSKELKETLNKVLGLDNQLFILHYASLHIFNYLIKSEQKCEKIEINRVKNKTLTI